MTDDESWSVYRKLVMSEMRRLSDSISKLDARIDKRLLRITEDISSLKVKAGIWGFLCGLIPSAIAVWWNK